MSRRAGRDQPDLEADEAELERRNAVLEQREAAFERRLAKEEDRLMKIAKKLDTAAQIMKGAQLDAINAERKKLAPHVVAARRRQSDAQR